MKGLIISILGIGGHTELNFAGNALSIEWKETTEAEKKSLSKLVEDAKSKGYKTVGDAPANFDGAGSTKMEGGNGLKLIAENFVNANFTGNLVMEALDNGENKILSAKSLEIKETEKQSITIAPAVVGG